MFQLDDDFKQRKQHAGRSKQQHTVSSSTTILVLPSEITFKILEFLIADEFYFNVEQQQTNGDDNNCQLVLQLVENIQKTIKKVPKRRDLYNLFEEFKNYLLIHPDLFYNQNLRDLHCNGHLLDIWRKMLLMYDLVYRVQNRIPFTFSEKILKLVRESKTGDEMSVKRLISAVLARFNSPQCILETFFNVKYSDTATGNSVPLIYSPSSYEKDIIREIMDSNTKEEENLMLLKSLLNRFPSLTQNPLFFDVILRKLKLFLVDDLIYSNEIRKIKKPKESSNHPIKKKETLILEKLLTLILDGDDCHTVIAIGEIISVILATVKIVCSGELFEKLLSKWILNPPSERAKRLNILIHGYCTALSSRYRYCFIESFIVSNQLKELEDLISITSGHNDGSFKISRLIDDILTLYFRKFELFQHDYENSCQQLISLIETCWKLNEQFKQDEFCEIVESLITSVCNKAIQLQDHSSEEKKILNVFNEIYFTLFSKRFLPGIELAKMDTIIINSKFLLCAIKHTVLFEHLMNNVGNSNSYRKQLILHCTNSNIFSTILSYSVSHAGNHLESIRMITETQLFDSLQLYEKRLRIVKSYLGNDTLFQKVLLDKSTHFNLSLDKINCEMAPKYGNRKIKPITEAIINDHVNRIK